MKKSKAWILWTLFKSMFVLSSCTFGGGFVIVSLMKKKFAGILGSLSAVFGTILPPMIVLSIISLFYNQFRTNKYIAVALQVMRAGVAAVIFDVVINLAKNVFKARRILYIAMMIIAFVCTYFLGVSAMIVILVCLGIGLLDLLVSVLKEKHKKEIR